MNKYLLALTIAASSLPATRAMAQENAPQQAPAAVRVSIVGEVAKPGVYQLAPGETLTQLLARAGRVTPTAKMELTVLRAGVFVSIDLQSELLPNFKLREGDVLSVHEKRSHATLLGAVKAPGKFELSDNKPITIHAAIVAAGGFDMDAEKYVPKILVIRQSSKGKPDDRESYVLPRDAAALEASAPLQTGDVIYVFSISKELGDRPPAGFQLLNTT